jgi:preprotein translocase subunit YajC
MFITPAFAQTGGAESLNSWLQNPVFVLIPMFAIMYFLIIRPQRQKQKAHLEMIKNVRRGDTIVTTGGLVGKVVKVVDDSEIQVELSENVRVRVVRSAIHEVRAKGEPVNDNG